MTYDQIVRILFQKQIPFIILNVEISTKIGVWRSTPMFE